MSQRKKSPARRAGYRYPTAAVAPVAAHSPQFAPPQFAEAAPAAHSASVWGRRRVLLLNSTYEPLTALPMRPIKRFSGLRQMLGSLVCSSMNPCGLNRRMSMLRYCWAVSPDPSRSQVQE